MPHTTLGEIETHPRGALPNVRFGSTADLFDGSETHPLLAISGHRNTIRWEPSTASIADIVSPLSGGLCNRILQIWALILRNLIGGP